MQKLSKKKIERIIKEVKTKGYSIIPNVISKKSCKFFCELLENDYSEYLHKRNLLDNMLKMSYYDGSRLNDIAILTLNEMLDKWPSGKKH